MEEHTSSIVLGRVVNFHVHESVLDSSGACVDLLKLQPVSRGGGNTYITVGHSFDLARPTVSGNSADNVAKK